MAIDDFLKLCDLRRELFNVNNVNKILDFQ